MHDPLIETTGQGEGPERNLAEAIRRRFASFGGIDGLQPHPPVTVPELALFDSPYKRAPD